jgi:hypothetical protein
MAPRPAARRLVLAASLAAGLLVGACKEKPGQRCTGGGVCDGPSAALLCVSGQYVPAKCLGEDGCVRSPFRCDYRDNPAGDRCAGPREQVQCARDWKARVRCADGRVVRDECDGPQGCFNKGDSEAKGCDRRMRVGSDCDSAGDWCAAGGTEWVTCANGKMILASKCRGPAGCKPFEGTVACDVSIAEPDDICLEKGTACSPDGTKVLVCRGGTMKIEATCPPARTCRMSSEGATCIDR